MRIITKAVLAVSMAVMCAGTAHAQEKGSSRSYDWEGTHEITFKAGLHSWELGLHIHNNSHSVSYHDSKTVYTPSFALEYGFNTEKWMSVGMGVYYGMARTRLLDASGELLKTEDIHDLSVMINIRFYWLNRPLIRMYSGIGTGCSISMHREDDAQSIRIHRTGLHWMGLRHQAHRAHNREKTLRKLRGRSIPARIHHRRYRLQVLISKDICELRK